MFARLNAGRSQGAINRDLSVRAADTLPNTPENVKLWKQNPRRIDIEGIDTPIKKGESINKIKDNSRLPERRRQETREMEKIKISDTVEMTIEKIMHSYGGYTELGIIYDVKKDGKTVPRPTYSDDFTDDELDKIELEIRNAKKTISPDYPIAVKTDEEQTLRKVGGVDLVRRDMYYTIGDTYPVKDDIRATGMHWNSDIKKWESTKPITVKIEGITFEKIPTYKTKNQWAHLGFNGR